MASLENQGIIGHPYRKFKVKAFNESSNFGAFFIIAFSITFVKKMN